MALFPFRPPHLNLGITAQRICLEETGPPWYLTWQGSGRSSVRLQTRQRILPPGLVSPSSTVPNISDTTMLAEELRELVGRGRFRWHGKPVALKLPDQCGHVTLLDFESWPSKPNEADSLLRWRLQKEFNLSGDLVVVHRAFGQVSDGPSVCERAPSQRVRVLAVTIQRNILSQYQRVCSEAGVLPVVIHLAALQSLDLHRPAGGKPEGGRKGHWFVLFCTDESMAFLAVQDRRPAFIRLKPLRNGGCLESSAVVAELKATIQFYEDRLDPTGSRDGPPRPLYVGGSAACLEGLVSEAGAIGNVAVIRLPPSSVLSQKAWIPTWDKIRRLFRRSMPSVETPRLNLSFVEDSYRTARAAQWGMLLLALTALAAMLWVKHDSRLLTAQAQQYEEAAMRVETANSRFAQQAAKAGIMLTEERGRKLVQEVLFVNRVMAQEAFSWTKLLTDLEETVPTGVAISSINLNFKERMVTLNGAALTLKDLTTFVDVLEKHAAFQNVLLGQHHLRRNPLQESTHSPKEKPLTVALPQPSNTVEFTMTVVYQPVSGRH